MWSPPVSTTAGVVRSSRGIDLTFYLQQTQGPGIVRGFFVPSRMFANGSIASI